MTQDKKPPPKTVVLDNATNTHLVCRDLMHAWSWQTDLVPHRIDRKVVEVTRMLACLRCAALREDTYKVPTFERVKSRYIYPDGYLVQGRGHVPVQDVRREVYHRMTKGSWI